MAERSKRSAPDDVKTTITRWKTSAEAQSTVHKKEATKFTRANFALGLPTVVISAIVATAMFATLKDTAADPQSKLIFAGISAVAAVLAAVQTFLRFSERAGEHTAAASEYSDVARRLGILQLSVAKNTADGWYQALESMSQQLHAIERRFATTRGPALGSSFEGDLQKLQVFVDADDSSPPATGA